MQLNEVSTAILAMALRARLSDQLYDPEPSFDGALNQCSSEFVYDLYNMLETFKKETEEV